MKFNINNYTGKYAMHCKTKEEAENFCHYLHNLGQSWSSGKSYVEKNFWEDYGEDTTYDFNTDTYAHLGYYKDKRYTILEWEDFMNKTFTKKDLKTGDVIKRRNGEVEIVNLELGMFICKTGWNDLAQIRENLTNTLGESYDIVAVRRPKTKSDCVFKAFDYEWGTLVYKRREVEEMTLEQVCKLLGKEIKIIK